MERRYASGNSWENISYLKQDFGSEICNFNAAMFLARLGNPRNALIEGPGKYIKNIYLKEALMRYVGETRHNPVVLRQYCLTQDRLTKQIGMQILEDMGGQYENVAKIKASLLEQDSSKSL